jgi:exosortase/archaeosortase family protein
VVQAIYFSEAVAVEFQMSVIRQLNLRFIAVMASFVGVIFLTYRQDVLGFLLAPLTRLTARTTLALLHLAGMEAVRVTTLIYHPDGFAYEIYYRCTGFLPLTFLAVSILAYRGPLRCKFVGLAAGLPILVTLNFTRLVHLFYIGVYNPAAFDIAHTIVWETLLIVAIIGIWMGWTRWSDKRVKKFRTA